MIRVPRASSIGVVFVVLCNVVFGACNDAGRTPAAPGDAPSFAAKAASVSVKSTEPAFGDQGQINETVTITGSGFKSGANAAWLRKGVVDATISVVSTQFVNSTTLVAVIN